MYKKIGLSVMFLAAVFAGCASGPAEEAASGAEYRKISYEEAKQMMDDGGRIIDVRTKEEHDSGHIVGAELLPLDRIQAGELDALADKDEILLVYCRSGNRSQTASRALVAAGYTQVYDFGGINNWPYGTEK